MDGGLRHGRETDSDIEEIINCTMRMERADEDRERYGYGVEDRECAGGNG